MRRFFTSLFVVLTAIAVRATDYNVPITVTVNGVTSEQSGVISIVERDGVCDLTLKNFMLQTESGLLGVGNVALEGIKAYQDGDAILLIDNRIVTITAGDDPNVPYWFADVLPPVPVELRGKIEGGHLRCCLDIDLTTTLQQVIQVSIGGGYQLANSSFETWHISAVPYVEPNGWHSFESATGDLASLAGHHIERSSDSHTGMSSARLYATSIWGIVANGTMTTGRMNAGAMSAADVSNHAYLDMSKSDTDGNGDPFYAPLYSRPDAVAVWVKFKQGTANSDHPYATISAVITDGTRYQDPEDKVYSNVVAKAKNNTIATTGSAWVCIEAPFVYTDNAVDPQAVLITLSTNADAGQGSKDDELLVDDISLIYNASVTSLSVKGQPVPGFSTAKTDYEMELNSVITADDIEVATDGRATHVIKEVAIEDNYYVCTIRAIGADMGTMTTYVVKVKSSETAICSLQPVDNQPVAYYTLDGRQTQTLTAGQTYLCRKSDGSVVKIRK